MKDSKNGQFLICIDSVCRKGGKGSEVSNSGALGAGLAGAGPMKKPAARAG